MLVALDGHPQNYRVQARLFLAVALFLIGNLVSVRAEQPASPETAVPSPTETSPTEASPTETSPTETSPTGATAKVDSGSQDEVDPDSDSPEIGIESLLVLPAVGDYGRSALHRDVLETLLVAGKWQTPAEGHPPSPDYDGELRWRKLAIEEGQGDSARFDTQPYRGGYALAIVDSLEERIVLLEARGHAAVFVNGAPRAGDPYGLGWMRLPVLLQRGSNELLFHLASDSLAVRLVSQPDEPLLDDRDLTLPSWVTGETEPVWGAVPIVNASRAPLADARLECQTGDGETLATAVPVIEPLSVYKAAFQIPAPGTADAAGTDVGLKLVKSNSSGASRSQDHDSTTLASLNLQLTAVAPTDVHFRTFRSSIDGSVQRYAVQPASGGKNAADNKTVESASQRRGLILTLHGAAVEADNQIAQYGARHWAHVVAPAGRRPYGFDWEDWGRIDALEVLADSQRHYQWDSRRVYLTGHSMGGHGAWHLGVSYPGRFAAVGPSAGWASFWSYGGGMPSYEDPSPTEAMLLRGNLPSDTLRLLGNLRDTGVYILHGANDNNVPVSQARFLRSRLADFHRDFAYYEQQNAGHWWGAPCCDWPRMMEFFQHHSLPESRDVWDVDFATASPGVAHGTHWLSIEAQQRQLEPSRVVIQRDLESRLYAGKTVNVARLAIDVSDLEPSRPVMMKLDDTPALPVTWPEGDTRLWFQRDEQQWRSVEKPSLRVKGPHRYGAFKSVFDNRALLVYGTSGTRAENSWARQKARFDAETFWYRGNGAFEVLPDTRFDPGREPDRNVVLYGNAETNAAWPALLSTCPVQVRRGRVQVGIRPESGDDLAVLLAYPRPGSDRALVGVVAGTGPVGMRATTRLRYFVSGVAYPDLLIFGPGVFDKGSSDIRALGYFGLDWQVDSGEIVWRDVAL